MNAFQRSAFQNNAFQGGGTPPVPTGPTWGTFPNWWPSRKKKLEEEFAAEVAVIVEPLPDRSAEIVSELSRQLMRDRSDVVQLRSLVKAKLKDEAMRFTAAAKEAVAKIEAASLAMQQEEQAAMEAQRKIRRNQQAMIVLKMLH